MDTTKKIQAIDEALRELGDAMKECDLCPRECGVDRTAGNKGFCEIGAQAVLYTSFLHQGEEPCISGTHGSGTLFFAGCSLQCVYCQNYKFSHYINGKELSDQELAEEMLGLQKKGAENINLVTPTHIVVPILRALRIAYQKGLNIPVAYNTSGYELPDVIAMLEGVVDVYLTDIKYMDAALAEKLSGARDYPALAQESFVEMYEQARHHTMHGGLLKKGVIVRHLVIPGQVKNTLDLLRYLQDGGFKDCFLSLMFQYRPYFKAGECAEINRPVTAAEYKEVTDFFYSYCRDITNGWVQDLDTDDTMAGINF